MAACLDCGGSECICSLRRMIREQREQLEEAQRQRGQLLAALEKARPYVEEELEAWGDHPFLSDVAVLKEIDAALAEVRCGVDPGQVKPGTEPVPTDDHQPPAHCGQEAAS